MAKRSFQFTQNEQFVAIISIASTGLAISWFSWGFFVYLSKIYWLFFYTLFAQEIFACIRKKNGMVWNLIFYTRKPWLLLVFRQNKRFPFFLSTYQCQQNNCIESLLRTTVYLNLSVIAKLSTLYKQFTCFFRMVHFQKYGAYKWKCEVYMY